MEVSAQRCGAMDEQGGMNADEHRNPENEKEQDVADAPNAKDFLDQEDLDEFSQNVGHACNSSPANPRNDGHERGSCKKQGTKQNVETSTLREVLALELQFDQSTSSSPSKV